MNEVERTKLLEVQRSLMDALRCLVGPREYGPAETEVGSDTPVMIRCQLGDLRRGWEALAKAGR